MSFRWNLAPPQPALAASIASKSGISPLLAQCLLNRGLAEPESIAEYLAPRLKKLTDPFLLPAMDAAVDRLMLARKRAEQVTIFGDYDVDGVTSTALLIEVFQSLGWRVNYHLPQRLDEGYGLSREGLERCLEKLNPSLLLAVDCGSTAVATIGWLKQLGIDVIVLDHHQVADPAPPANALVNPQLIDDANVAARTCKNLCSAGLAFKLAHGLVKQCRKIDVSEAFELDLRQFLDLVALGTIADMAPLTGENRVLVKAGLKYLNDTARPGLQALKSVAQVKSPIQVYEIGFQLGPRLNAAGRLEDAETALHLLLEKDSAQAESLANELDARNRDRQTIERAIADEVIETVRAKFNPETDYAIIEGKSCWHIGVVGIVAARVLRQFYRPTIILGGDGDNWRGSGRSIEGFDLAAALRQCSDLLIRHGGHAMAAGITVHSSRLVQLRQRLNQSAKQQLKPGQLVPALALDATVALGEMTLQQLKELQALEPLGQGNPAVQLVCLNIRCHRPTQRIGKDQQHAKLWVTDGNSVREAVWWKTGDAALPTGAFDLAFTPKINQFNSRRTVQLEVLDWRPSA